MDPEIVCRDQLTTQVAIHGDRFSPIPIDIPNAPKAALPTITLLRSHELDGTGASGSDSVTYSGDPDKDPINAFGADGKPLLFWKSQKEMSFVVNQQLTLGSGGKKGMLPSGIWDVQVRNANGHSAESKQSLAVVDKPAVAGFAPGIVCLDQGPRTITLSGQNFLRNGDKKAVLEVEGVDTPFAAELSDCSKVAHTGLDAELCKTAQVELAKGSIAPGFPALDLHNPETAACKSTDDQKLRVVPAPMIASAAPALVCTVDGSKPIVITGQGFLKVGTELPAVRIGGGAVASVDAVGGCSDLPVNGLMVQSCTTIDVTVAKTTLMTGRPEVEVQNPDPAGCTATRADVLTVPPELMIASLAPLNVCQNTASSAFPIKIMGQGFLRVGSADFTLSFDGKAVTPTAVTGCAALEVADGSSVSSCTGIEAKVNLSGKTATPGMLPISVSNANAPGCALSAMTALNVVAPPAVTGIDIANTTIDNAVCSDLSFTVIVSGTGFVPGTSVTFQNSHAKSIAADSVSVMSATQLTATFGGGLPYDATDPSYDLVVATADNCSGPPLVDVIIVNPTPLVFFVDPPIAYNAISIDATVFTSGLSVTSQLDKIELVGPDPGTAATALTVVSNPKPNRIVARIPGIDSATSQPTFVAGNYTVRVTSKLGCSGELPGGVKLTDTTDSALVSKIAPSFVSPTVATAVTVTGSGLMAVPRLYLTPNGGNGTATALRSVELQSATDLSAIVPAGIAAGNYDLVLVNPDGKVGLLPNGVTVTSGEPPVIASVVPASLVSNATTTVTATGQGFDVASMVLECKATSTATTVTMVTGTLVGTPTATQAKASFNMGTVAAGSICLLKLTNTDGAFFEYSAVSTTNSSLNISPWTTSDGSATPKPTPLTTGRRALSLVAGRPTATSRFLYAIGGDSGVSGAGHEAQIGSSVFADVEAANVDVYGAMGSWAVQTRTPLLAPRTWAGAATVGRFIYLVGGHDGSSATDSLYRAQILDPLASTEVSDLDAVLGDGTLGLGGGFYYYGVAAIFPSNDPSNPSGESLTGELLPVQLPDRPEKIQLTLTWQPVAGAHGYRIYRSPTPGAAVGALQLLAEKTCGSVATDTCGDCTGDPSQCRLLDDGSVAPSGNGPLPAGALGTWHAVDGARCTSANCLLSVKREALATVAVRNPSDASKYFLYAVGGRNESGTYQSGYEVAVVSVASNGTQTVADWTTGGTALSSARAELGVWVMTADNSALIRSSTATDVWFYLGGGRTTGGGIVTTMQSGQLQANGNIGTSLTSESALKAGGAAGFGAGASNDHLYVFGGDATAPKGMSADLMSPLPTLPANSWNSLGAAQTSRMYMGSAQESAFFFMAGGWFGGAALSSTEQTVQ